MWKEQIFRTRTHKHIYTHSSACYTHSHLHINARVRTHTHTLLRVLLLLASLSFSSLSPNVYFHSISVIVKISVFSVLYLYLFYQRAAWKLVHDRKGNVLGHGSILKRDAFPESSASLRQSMIKKEGVVIGARNFRQLEGLEVCNHNMQRSE